MVTACVDDSFAVKEQVRIDDTIRRHLTDIATVRFLPSPFPQLFGRLNLFVTTGFMPERFREEMRLSWSRKQQHRWNRLMGVVAQAVSALPGPLRRFPYNACLLDMRIRIRLGRRLV